MFVFVADVRLTPD